MGNNGEWSIGDVAGLGDGSAVLVKRLNDKEFLGLPIVAGPSGDPWDLPVADSEWNGPPALPGAVVRVGRPFPGTPRAPRGGRLGSEILDRILRAQVKFASEAHWEAAPSTKSGYLPPSGKSLDTDDVFAMVDATLDRWLTTGRFNDDFERDLASFLGVRHALTVNSGSSANLLAVTALLSENLGEKRLRPGDEVLTVAAGFPTTVAPIVQNGLVPVFVDVEVGTYNADPSQIEEAVGPQTKAIMLAHTLGNPFAIDAVLRVAEKHKLWVIEDNCDALGSTFRGRFTGTFGHIATCSFYPAHHITMGEGGAVLTNDGLLTKTLMSLRDWGRDCWCPPGKDNTCRRRFDQQHGRLPAGYDHKYVYSHLGYNLKISDWQAAIGSSQLRKLPAFAKKRRENFQALSEGLCGLEEFLILPRPTEGSDPSWFGFPLSVRNGVDKVALVKHLESAGIGTRNLFAGNMLRQPAFVDSEAVVRIRTGGPVRARELTESHFAMISNTDAVMNRTFWVGVWPGIGPAEIQRMAAGFRAFFPR